MKLLGGTLQPFIDLLKSGTIKVVAGILGRSNLAAGEILDQAGPES